MSTKMETQSVQTVNLTEVSNETQHSGNTNLVDRYIDEARPLKVAVIGAGLAGIIAGILLPAKVPGIKLTILRKMQGGTWFENIYPGVRCDIPAHVYQTSFDPNTQWSEKFAQGAEIRAYWEQLAEKYDVYKFLQLQRKVEELSWDEKLSVWKVFIKNTETNELLQEDADYVITANGRFNNWRLPDYPGRSDYKGILRHTSNWDPKFDLSGKRVAVIGNGASGIQVTTHIQKRVKQLDHYARNRTWVATSFGGDDTSIEPIPISEELRQSFDDEQIYLNYRKTLEEKYWRGFTSWLKGSTKNEDIRETLTKITSERLAMRPDLLENIIPEFSPQCRRLTPGPGYLEAISQDNVSYITMPIKRFTETGIETIDGEHRKADAIFCATGAAIDMLPPFKIKAYGKEIGDLWRPGGEIGFPYTYLGVASPGFPNLGFLHGPHGTGRTGSVPFAVETQVTFFAKLLRKLSREGIKTIQPSIKASNDFVQYAKSFFQNTVLTENCSSWYNSGRAGSFIHGLFPGSSAELAIIHQNPRWEDWEYEYLLDNGNRFLWYFGKGSTKKEEDPEADVTTYLQPPSKINLQSLHEGW